jgi:hypothetical protein
MRQKAPPVPARLGGDADILERGRVGEDIGDLVRAGDAPVRDSVGRNTPVRQLKNVLLPAPFGPMTARISSRWSSKLT